MPRRMHSRLFARRRLIFQLLLEGERVAEFDRICP